MVKSWSELWQQTYEGYCHKFDLPLGKSPFMVLNNKENYFRTASIDVSAFFSFSEGDTTEPIRRM